MSIYPIGTLSTAGSHLPATQPIHVVRSGESLQDIADQLGVTPASLLAANPSIRNPDAVYPGTHLLIPEDSPLAAKAFAPHAEPLAPGTGAPAEAQVRTSALQTLDKDFSVFDTAAHGGKGDGKISKQDLQHVADDSKYSANQRAAAQYLLKNGDFYTRLDTAKHGGTPDGTISRNDVNAAKADQSLYTGTATFDGTDPSVSFDSGDRSGTDPKSAAIELQYLRKFSDSDTANPDARSVSTGYVMNQLQAHKNDPTWLKSFFQQLGSKESAEYLNHIADPQRYDGLSESQAKSILSDARTALQTMYESGALNDADISRLVENWARQGGDPNSGFAQLIAGLGGPQAQSIKNAFANACIELSLAGKANLKDAQFSFTSDAGKWLSDGDRKGLASAAAYVLAGTSEENQANQLLQLHAEGGDGAVSTFISQAMAGPTQVQGLTALTADAQQRRAMGDDSGQQISYGSGVAQLVQSLANVTPDSVSVSSAKLVATRDAAFNSAVVGLDKNASSWEKNTTLKDALASIFMKDYSHLLGTAQAGNKAQLDPGSPFPAALEDFAQHVLFTDPTGKLRDDASKFLVKNLSQTIADINGLSEAQFKQKYGADESQISHLVGQILGHVQNGLEKAVKTAGDKYAAQQQALQFNIDLALSIGSDLFKLVPGSTTLTSLLPSAITGTSTFGLIKGEIETDLKQGLTDKASALLLQKFPDLHADPSLTGLEQKLSTVLVDTNTQPYLAQLQVGYSDAIEHPAS